VPPPPKPESLPPSKPASLKVRALQWLAQREHSPLELRGKLMRLAQRAAAADRAGPAAQADSHDAAQGGAQDNRAKDNRAKDNRVEGNSAQGTSAQDNGAQNHGARDDTARVATLSGARDEFGASAARSTSDEVEAVMAWLTAHGYLSQQRFAESRVHARQARFGNLRITRELQQHGVKLEADAQQALRATEYERACDVWQRKYGSAGLPQDATARVRQMRFLAGRGFSPDVIRRVLRGPAADD
jgi:regulatory protein